MVTYKYLRIYISGSGIHIYSSDQSVWEPVVEDLKKTIPNLQKNESKYGEIEISKLGGQDLKVGHWIINRFLAEGWEPFAITTGHGGEMHTSASSFIGEALHLRKQDQ